MFLMRSLFAPSSIAVVGASADSSKVGNIIIRNILSSGFKGRIFPINPRETHILGLKAYRSVLELPAKADLAIFTIPSKYVADAMENAGKAGIRAAIVISAGFREEGPDGMRLEKELEEVRSRHGIRVVGPNCFGVMDTYSGLNATFSSLYPSPGNISLSSQSGAVGTSVLDWSTLSHRGLSKFLSLGNKMDLDESDVIDYLRHDSSTDVLALYVESIRDGGAFMESARNFAREKPLLVLKSGRTGHGAKAASSHTGALAGSDSVYESALRKVNAVRVKDLDELFDALSLFSSMPVMQGDGVAVLTNAGGLGVMAADACGDYGLSLSELQPETVHRLEVEVPSLASATNPVDIRGDASSQDFRNALQILSEDEQVNAIIGLVSPVDTVDMDEVAKLLGDFRVNCNMPLVAAFVGGTECLSPIRILREKKVPDYPTPDRAVRALSMMFSYREGRLHDHIPMALPDTSGRAVVEQVVASVLAEGRNSLTEGEGKEILSAYGINVPQEGDAACSSAAADLADSIGYPVVMKVISPDIQHKTDIGGVVVNVFDRDSVITNHGLIMERCRRAMPEARIDGVSVQRQVRGAEVIVSVVRDEQFGPVLSFGAGGIFVEMMKEISQGIAPMSEKELDDLLRSTRVYQLLTGIRGRPASDIEALKDLMKRLMTIALENEQILELEINPVMVDERGKGCWAVDALVTIGGRL